MRKGKEKDEHRERVHETNGFAAREEEESSSDGVLDPDDERQAKLIGERCNRVRIEKLKEVLEKANIDDA